MFFYAVCLDSFSSWCPEPNQTGLQAGNFQGPAWVLPSPFALDWGGTGGLAFMEMNGWRNQNLNRLYCARASKGAVARQGLWSWGKHRRGKGLVWGEHPCSWPHKKTVTHRCEDIQRKRVDMDILSTHNRTLMHEHALSHEEHAALFSLMPVCTWGKVTRSHSVLVAVLRCNVSPWMPL